MAAIDFPDSPSENDVFTVGDKSWRYSNGVWILVPYSNPFVLNLDGGTASSVYGGIASVDGGGV
jgi:hypothetical protein